MILYSCFDLKILFWDFVIIGCAWCGTGLEIEMGDGVKDEEGWLSIS